MTAHGWERRALPSAGGRVLELLWQHRLLSGQQLKRLLAPETSNAYISKILRELARRELVEWAGMRAPGSGRVWFLTERGGDVVACGPTFEARRLILPRESAEGALQAHTIAVNEVGVLFVEAARRRGDECGAMAWRHEINHRISNGRGRGRSGAESLQADALLNYAVILPGGRLMLRYLFVELDRATEPADALAEKLRQYARFYHHKAVGEEDLLAGEYAWRRHYPLYPQVLIVLTGRPRPALELRIRSARALAAQDPFCRSTPELQVFFTLLEELQEAGPFARVLRPLAGGEPVDFIASAGQTSPPSEKAA
jgi:hypothetical protein